MASIIRDLIVEKIRQAVEEAHRDGILRLDTMPDIAVEHPSNPEHGDFATSLPLRLARVVRISPMKIAEELVNLIPVGDEVEGVSVAAPGFINFRLKDRWLAGQVDVIREAGQSYGVVGSSLGQKVLVEYVSVNPTGPVHVGHTRGAVLGSTLARVLDAGGHAVSRVYYFYDAGWEMEAFYKQALGHEAELPPNGYAGAYIMDIAREIVAREGDRFISMSEEGALVELGRIAREMMVQLIREDLQHIGVEFDSWFSEGSLYQSGEYDKVIDILRREGYVSEREGAQWFTSTALGDEKDNVIIRSTGVPTYFASDIAYHYDKFIRRGYDRAINIWGADHQGHVARMNAAVAALGVEPGRLTTMISQMVTLRRGQEVVRASKRTGEFITLRELVDEVGADACRYFFLARTPSTQMEFDLELAKKESSENPVYYVQYGHARIGAILNNAMDRGIDWSEGDTSLLVQPTEAALIRKMVLLPELVESMARTLEPHHLPHY
ncbi:MAG: arginine--tRNA ligase, partial [Dehalococcoidia bacterium]|nr:arginine--tRNA ligase [Dehalococcoidia bacterium]